MRRTGLVLAMLAVLTTAGEARADSLTATRGQALVEVSHTVDLKIEGGVARYRVQRTFANSGTQAEEAALRVVLAHGAAVTGLRIRAGERWYEGALMDAEEARTKYQELTGVGQWELKDPALVEWVWADEASLRVFPVVPGGVSTVEYTLTAPLEYRGGRHVLTYPLATVEEGADVRTTADPVLRVDPGHGDMRTEIRVGGQRVAANRPVVLRPAPAVAWVGEGEPDLGSGYLFSSVGVERTEQVKSAHVTVDIDHTYRGDLEVKLVTPGGEHLPVTQGESDGNDLRGTFEVALPAGTGSKGDWTLVVADRAGLDVGTLDAWSLKLEREQGGSIVAAAVDLPRFIPDAPDSEGDGGHVLIEVEPPRMQTLAGRLGRVVASAERGFHRLEIDAAPQLSALPKQASVVFVLDRSRSMSEALLEGQLRVIDAYRSHVPDAVVEVVVFDREARRVLGALVGGVVEGPDGPVDRFKAALEGALGSGKLDGGNGSALEEGLAVAAGVLAGRPGPTRIVAVTDGALRTRFDNALAEVALAAGPKATVTHVVLAIDDDVASLTRDDTHALAPIADGHHGVFYVASAPAGDKANVSEMLALVRPVAIDSFAVRGMDLEGARELPGSLREGSGYRAMLATREPSRRVVLSGKLWATPVRRVVTHQERFDVATAAFVFSEDEHHDLSDAEMRVVALRGRAVSPVTSYLAIEPGVRPSREGLEGGGSGGFGGASHCGGSGGMHGTGRVTTPPPALKDLLAQGIAACVARHGSGGGWQVTLGVETTGPEVVDVEAKAAGTASPLALRECLVEATWSLALPSAAWPEREQHTIVVP